MGFVMRFFSKKSKVLCYLPKKRCHKHKNDARVCMVNKYKDCSKQCTELIKVYLNWLSTILKNTVQNITNENWMLLIAILREEFGMKTEIKYWVCVRYMLKEHSTINKKPERHIISNFMITWACMYCSCKPPLAIDWVILSSFH